MTVHYSQLQILFNYCQHLHTKVKLRLVAACNVFIPLPEELRKNHPVHIQWHLVHEVCGLLSSFSMNILLVRIRYLLFLNTATHTFVNFAASVDILISKQPAPLLPPSFTVSLTTATHFTMTYLTIN